ncbi:outer membrane beta-barrel protein [Hymenobacter psoromatis]|uniref:outer membrane beta-barrel protein n=1 Tax=Hymenobacter psoromatis TaxID=1484116 RepID=UPI001CBDFB73
MPSPFWVDGTFYSNYALSDMVGLEVRYEYFEDEHGVRHLRMVNNSISVATSVTPAVGKLQVKPDFRINTAPVNYHENSSDQNTPTQTPLGGIFIY